MTVKELEELSQKHPILFYDGVCLLCNNFVQFAHKRDKQDVLRFATLQDESGQILKTHLGLVTSEKDETVILMYKSEVLTHSDVSFEIFKLLGWPYKGLVIFSIIPKKLRDAVYLLIARNRYKWFGKSDECLIPQGKLKDKLLY